jgi:hypothetical protein
MGFPPFRLLHDRAFRLFHFRRRTGRSTIHRPLSCRPVQGAGCNVLATLPPTLLGGVLRGRGGGTCAPAGMSYGVWQIPGGFPMLRYGDLPLPGKYYSISFPPPEYDELSAARVCFWRQVANLKLPALGSSASKSWLTHARVDPPRHRVRFRPRSSYSSLPPTCMDGCRVRPERR